MSYRGGLRGVRTRRRNILILASLAFLAAFQSGCAGLVSGKSSSTGGSQGTLAISNVGTATITSSAASISWQTSVPATSQVEYGTSASYGSSTAVDSTMVTSHLQSLSGLAAGTLYHYRVHSSDSSNNAVVSADLTFTTASAGSDTTPPTVSISAPATGAAVSGTVTITASASDNVGVASVQFQLDGASLGAPVTAAPYATSWNTAGATNGSHSLAAIAKDAAGNAATSSLVIVTVNNASAPSITTQPASQSVTAGQTATFAVVATGTAPLSYQWQKNSVNISGATSATYTTPVTTTSDSGSTFRVIVTNSAGSATSSAATLTVTAAAVAPTITTQPVSQSVTAGQTATFAVVATGTAPLSYQWQKNSVNISGATSATYTTPVTTTSDSGSTFRVIVTNSAGSATSSAATLTVTAAAVAPTITTQPLGQSVTAGQTATFAVVATGTAPLSYQWQKNSANISGATSATYTTPVTTTADSGSTFRVVVANSAGSATSSAATLTVTAAVVAPTITTQPVSQSVTAGQTATFAVVATGTAPLSYQWQKNSVNISGATSASYTTPVTTTADSGSTFRVVVTNSAGSATSSAATLTVTAAAVAPTITTQPVSQSVTAGQTATFAVVATGTAPLTYQWQKNSANISGATSATYITPVTTTSDNGAAFTVIVSNSAGNVTSSAATLSVAADTTPPSVSIAAPSAGATVSGTITVSANASDNIGVASVQFQLDGANLGALDTTSPYSISWDTTTATNASHTLTAIAKDAAGNTTTSAAVAVTVSNAAASAMGPLVQSATSPAYFVTPNGKPIFLSGSHTWDTFQDLDQSTNPAAFDFTAYVNFLKANGHNVTILWRKDLPTYCGWGAGGVWTIAQWPWKRTGPGFASDGKPQFDLTQFDQTYFDRLRSRAQTLAGNGIYAIVQLFDGLQLVNNRCSNDGYPFTAGNNVNGVSDGGGANSITMSAPNTITGYQDAYVKKVIDTLNDVPNVIWEISEESPSSSAWWQGHMIGLIKAYEGGGTWEGVTYTAKPAVHPVGLGEFNTSDGTLFNTNAIWTAPSAQYPSASSCGSGTPQCKAIINDSDHAYYGMWNDSAQTNRNYLWRNLMNGVGGVIFMDPYLIYWSNSSRNLCSSPTNGVCSAPDSRWDNFRANMGYMVNYANTRLDLAKVSPHGSLSSTGYCLADNAATGAEYLVYSTGGGSFTVNLSATTRTLNVEWLNPSTGAVTNGGTISGGSASQSFTPPFSGDAVLYLVDSAGHN